jgi:hypothetical protein
MGTLELIIAGLLAVFGSLGYAFKKRGDAEKAKREVETRRAGHNQAASDAQAEATKAMARTGKRHREQRTKPNTQKRDDLEGDW